MPQRWAWFAVIGAVAVCLIGGTLAFVVVWPRVWEPDDSPQQRKVSQAVASSLQISITTRIARDAAASLLRLTDADFDLNNTINRDGSGIEIYSIGVVIFGFTASITPEGITIRSGDDVAYSGVPVVEDGRIEMIRVEAYDEDLERLLTSRGIEDAFENAFETSMMISGRRPTGIELGEGMLIIHTAPRS